MVMLKGKERDVVSRCDLCCTKHEARRSKAMNVVKQCPSGLPKGCPLSAHEYRPEK
jgi:hypothetical protein